MARREATPGHLIFGLLALQSGLIDHDQLVAALKDWSRGGDKTIAQILLERGLIDLESHESLSARADELLKLDEDTEEASEHPTTDQSTCEIPAPTEDTDVDDVTGDWVWNASGNDPKSGMADGNPLTNGQRYRLLRHHAEGGLGAVFVALDEDLNREVALKQIRPERADDGQSRARFQQEAKITGQLEHPGIVPVYGVGLNADGRPFYAMRFIRGDSLKQAISKFHDQKTIQQRCRPAKPGTAEVA